MRRAGRYALHVLREFWPEARHVKVYCGSGNNAGDGYILAGLALNSGLSATVVQIGKASKLQGNALQAFDWYNEQQTAKGQKSDDELVVLVDALLGTGTKGEIRPNYVKAIAEINASSKPVLAIDIPSGIDPDTGRKLTENPVFADVTTTFIGKKIGLLTGDGVNYAGHVRLDDLGVPEEVYEVDNGIDLIPESGTNSRLPRRKPGAYKNQSGHVLVIGGDLGTGGAALLTGQAALRTGAGLVSVLTRPEHIAAYLSNSPELMVRGVRTGEPIETYIDRADVIAIGPGLGNRRWGELLLDQVLTRSKPKVLDADALNILATRSDIKLTESVITPHPGEAARLLNIGTREVEENRVGTAQQLANLYQCVVVLKGAGTIVADQTGSVALLPEAIPALATGGSGDVLTGILSASTAVLDDLKDATETAVRLHAEAGKRADTTHQPGVVLASDLIEHLQPW